MAKYERKPRQGFLISHELYTKHLMHLTPGSRALLIDSLALYSLLEAQDFFDGVPDAREKAFAKAVQKLKGHSELEVHFSYLVDFANDGIEAYERQTHGGRQKEPDTG